MDKWTHSHFHEYVRYVIAQYEKFGWLEDPTKPYLRMYQSMSETDRREMVRLMTCGESETKLGWQAKRLIAQMHLRERTPLPSELAEWVCDVLEGKLKKPGKGEQRYAMRDQLLADLVAEATVRLDLKATRNKISESTSACDVVSEALPAKYTYKVVSLAWEANKHRMEEERLGRPYEVE